jgi:hypothetical protein
LEAPSQKATFYGQRPSPRSAYEHEMVGLGIHGPSKAEVGSWVIRTWIWENQDQLRTNGISLKNATDEKTDD